MAFNNLDLLFVSEKGVPFVQNNTLDFGLQLMISHLGSIMPDSLLKERLPVNMEVYLAKNVSLNTKIS